MSTDSIDRRGRTTFEEVADLYQEVRSSYPDELVEDVLALSRIPRGGRILEIGCGPGKATVLFARRGYPILAIELGARMAELAREQCHPYPGVEIRNMLFEDWEVEPGAFDLAISAEAFHWIPPEIGYPKVARALRPSGSAAFFWYAPVDQDTDWSREIEAVYHARAPELVDAKHLYTAESVIERVTENFRASGAFGPVAVRRYTLTEPCTTDRYMKLLRTRSGHRALDSSAREQLYAGIRAVLDRFGGRFDLPQLLLLFHARVLP